jgi:hypothetical protein
MVAVSHGNFERVKVLVGRQPALARACWDWGFGDFEDALGAASHVGNRAIAGYLIANGARPTIFSAAMLGQVEVVKAFVAASPGVQRIKGPHGITLLSHAKAGGSEAVAVLRYLESLGDADPQPSLQPLTDAEKAALVGTYTFGAGPHDRITIQLTQQAQQATGSRNLEFLRDGGTARRIFHLGSQPGVREFFPTGADAVRIRFTIEGDAGGGTGQRAIALTVHDPELIVNARRAS